MIEPDVSGRRFHACPSYRSAPMRRISSRCELICLRSVERCVAHARRKDLLRHYLRHSVLFHQAGYNLIVTTTDSRPKEMTVSDTVNDEPITCASCEYRYSRSVEVCAMCGMPAPTIEPLRALSAIPDEFCGADHEACASRSDSQQKPPKPWLWRLIPIITVSIAMIFLAWFAHEIREGKLSKQSGPAAELTRTLEQAKLESAGPGHIVHNSARGVQHVAAKPGTNQATDSAKEDDPAELWNAVKRGSVPAEVALANLYLKGEAVPQNCEQAHMLLLAASMKGSKVADDFLKSSYAERCE